MDKNFYTTHTLTKDRLIGHIHYLAPFIDTIIRRVPNQGLSLLEVGIGTGACCAFLEKAGYSNSYGVDIEAEIIEVFNKNTRKLFNSNITLYVADAFDLSKIKKAINKDIGCVYHQGLLEHFSEEESIVLIEHHLGITDMYLIFAVPIKGYVEEGGVYDAEEVHLSLQEWLDKLKKYKLYEYGVFGVDINKDQAYFVLGKG